MGQDVILPMHVGCLSHDAIMPLHGDRIEVESQHVRSHHETQRMRLVKITSSDGSAQEDRRSSRRCPLYAQEHPR